MEILFVCTGNTCRSPLAEVLLREELAQQKIDGISVASAGIFAASGNPASAGSRTVLPSADLDRHRSRQVDEKIIAKADLILTMTAGHKESIIQLFPGAADKVHSLTQYAWGVTADIVDPFGGGQEEYEVALRDIEIAVKRVAHKLAETRETGGKNDENCAGK